jgi:heavy metal translocating P-type ATPase
VKLPRRYRQLFDLFKIPLFIIVGIISHLTLDKIFHLEYQAFIVIIATIAVGSIDLVRDTIASILRRHFVLDYIAILAITTGILSGEFLVAAVIVLMLAGGQTLEKYAIARAKKSLTALVDRIPSSVFLWEKGDIGKKIAIEAVSVGEHIFVRKGEVIPLDGILVSESGFADESSVTGEPYEIEKIEGDKIRSGTINIGRSMIIRVTRSDKDSTYRKIIEMVKAAQDEQSPMIRLADRYSGVFTAITLILAGFAYVISGDFHQVLAVLVIATPCPLILATPIALIGGMNALARHKVIVKTLASIEALARVTDIMFDKTGTITLGHPHLSDIEIKKRQFTRASLLGIAEAIERNSLHPLAKSLVRAARAAGAPRMIAHDVEEKIGHGIRGNVKGKWFSLSKVSGAQGIAIELRVGSVRVAVFHFVDTLKEDAKHILRKLKSHGIHMSIFTGDKKEATEHLIIKTECTPQDKMHGIKLLRRQGRVTAMVGDGINDAPAIAAADVGMVFSNEEHTAASEAADLIFLGGNFSLVFESLSIAKKTVHIALQSILFGIGLSVIGMILASLGYIPPLVGAFVQEIIDISVIFNALRASK